MAFNPLKEKGTPLEKQLRNWNEVVLKPYDKYEVDPYTRTRQILMNGIEIESSIFKHCIARRSDNNELKSIVAQTRLIEDQQQTTVNWLAPADQTILETTLAYEQVATDLTAYLGKIETDEYIRQVFDYGLLEDFDHLYRYSQMYQLLEGKDPNKILKGKTDVFPGRPTQDHHNDITLRIRNHYNKDTAKPATKVNILTILAGEQQTHNFYKGSGFMYSSPILRKLYAEIGQVEEEHVTMYESLIDPNETVLEKLLIHEFTEVCNYYTCMQDEKNERIKKIWEMCLSHELEHLRIAAELIKKHEKREPEEIIGSEIHEPSRFESQKEYVEKVIDEQVDLRLTDSEKRDFTQYENLPDDWSSYEIQEILNKEGSPSETVVRMHALAEGRDLVHASDALQLKETGILDRGLDKIEAPNTVSPQELEEMIKKMKV